MLITQLLGMYGCRMCGLDASGPHVTLTKKGYWRMADGEVIFTMKLCPFK